MEAEPGKVEDEEKKVEVAEKKEEEKVEIVTQVEEVKVVEPEIIETETPVMVKDTVVSWWFSLCFKAEMFIFFSDLLGWGNWEGRVILFPAVCIFFLFLWIVFTVRGGVVATKTHLGYCPIIRARQRPLQFREFIEKFNLLWGRGSPINNKYIGRLQQHGQRRGDSVLSVASCQQDAADSVVLHSAPLLLTGRNSSLGGGGRVKLENLWNKKHKSRV